MPLIFLLITFIALPTVAEPIELTCKTSDGHDLPVTINLENMKGTWGISSQPYEITHINDDLVTMMDRSDPNPGGEFLVINRATGEYQRGGVIMACDQNGRNCSMDTITQEAQCNRKVF